MYGRLVVELFRRHSVIPIGIDRPLIRKPYVTLALIGLNLLAMVIQVLAVPFGDAIVNFGFIPGYGSLVTLFTHMFLHGGPLHLAGNIVFFLVAGLKLEDALGHWRYLVFYLGCGIVANACHSIVTGNEPIVSIGASGAIAGIVGGFMVLYPTSQVKLFYVFWLVEFFMGTFTLPAWTFLGFWFGREVLEAFWTQYSGVQTGVATFAHIGGFLAGALWAWSFYGWARGPALEEAEEEQSSEVVVVAPTYQK